VALNRDHGITVLMVTHELDMAAYAHRMVTFVDGKIAKDVVNEQPTMPSLADVSMTEVN
jgi:putative ABC transport system ATP-binding protein